MDQIEQIHRKYLAATLIGSLILLSCQLLFPLSIDNEIFQSMAMDLFRFHRLPILGSWAHDFPGTVYVHWLAIVLFGDTALGFRVFDLLVHLGMSWMLFVVLRRWLPPRSAFLSVIFYNLHYISNFWFAGQRDAFAVCFLLLGTLLLMRVDRAEEAPISPITLVAGFGAGFCIAMMMTLRLTYAIFIPIGIVYLWRQPELRAKRVTSYLAGVMALVIALVMPYLFYPGGLEQAYLTTIRYNLELYGVVRIPRMLLLQFRLQKLFFGSAFIGLLFAFLPSLRGRGKVKAFWERFVAPASRDRLLIAGYALCGIISIWVMGKFWPYHFEPILIIIVPFGAIALETLVVAIPSRILQWAAVLLLIGYSVLRIFPDYIIQPYLSNVMHGVPHPLESLQDTLQADSGYPRSADFGVAAYIDRMSPPGARFETVTITPGVRWHTGRMSASRFTTLYPLIVSTPSGGHPPFQQAWRREYIDSLRSARPTFIVISAQSVEIFNWIRETPLQMVHEIPGFDSEIMPHYAYDTTIGGYRLFRRRD
ncbi:MAG: glycosyltransferase family 39 protein [Bacteroidota bacterium]|nr:glycosyltransferase family 39 protein [Bacteroidota bacterium]